MNQAQSPLAICTLGNPVLTQKALPVQPDLIDPVFLNQLQESMDNAHGVGIAAPQVGVSQRIMIISSKPNTRYPDAPLMTPTLMLNPSIVWQSKAQESDWEGCLSIPALRARVSRSVALSLEFDDMAGQRHREDFEGFIARIIQHEMDHLNGLTFLDRVNSTADLVSQSYFDSHIQARD